MSSTERGCLSVSRFYLFSLQQLQVRKTRNVHYESRNLGHYVKPIPVNCEGLYWQQVCFKSMSIDKPIKGKSPKPQTDR